MSEPILLIGYFGFHNLGDDLILYAFLYRLQSLKDRFIITVHKKYNLPVKQISRWNIIKIIFFIVFKKAVLLYPGGEIFQSESSFFSLLYYAFFPIVSRLFHRKYYLCFQGQTKETFSQNIFKNAAYVSFRDTASVPDIVFSYPAETVSASQPGVVFALKSVPHADFIILKSLVVDLMMLYPDQKFYFLPMHRKEDSRINRIMVHMLQSSRAVFSDWKGEPEKGLSFFKKASFVFSMRYHSSVLAMLFQRPFVSFSDSEKLQTFHKQWSPKNFVLRKNTIDYFSLKQKIEHNRNIVNINSSFLKSLAENELKIMESLLKG